MKSNKLTLDYESKKQRNSNLPFYKQPIDVAVVLWLFWLGSIFAYIMYITSIGTLNRDTPVWRAISIGLLPAILYFFCLLFFQGRWRAALVFLLFFLAIEPLASASTSRCPHATYFQIRTWSFTIAGKGCRNDRNAAPWWMERPIRKPP